VNVDNTPDSTVTAKATDPRTETWVDHDSGNPVAEQEPSPKGVQFIPKFKGAAEMEARRKMRMLARRGPLAADIKPPPAVVVNLNPESSSSSSSSDEEDGLSEEDDFDEITGAGDDMDDGDEFDP
jgi:hypothetical protein